MLDNRFFVFSQTCVLLWIEKALVCILTEPAIFRLAGENTSMVSPPPSLNKNTLVTLKIV